MKKNNHITTKVQSTTAIEYAKKSIRKSCHFMNKTHIKVSEKLEKASRHTIAVTLNLIQKEYPILKQEDMLKNVMPMVHTLLKNGKSLKESLIINVLIVKRLKILLKTISNHFLLMEQIIFQISNHYVEAVIVGNGRSFNIYQNPELLK